LRSHSAIRMAILAISSPAGVEVSIPSSMLTKAHPVAMSSSMNRQPFPAERNDQSPRKITTVSNWRRRAAAENLIDDLPVLG